MVDQFATICLINANLYLLPKTLLRREQSDSLGKYLIDRGKPTGSNETFGKSLKVVW